MKLKKRIMKRIDKIMKKLCSDNISKEEKNDALSQLIVDTLLAVPKGDRRALVEAILQRPDNSSSTTGMSVSCNNHISNGTIENSMIAGMNTIDYDRMAMEDTQRAMEDFNTQQRVLEDARRAMENMNTQHRALEDAQRAMDDASNAAQKALEDHNLFHAGTPGVYDAGCGPIDPGSNSGFDAGSGFNDFGGGGFGGCGFNGF